MLEIKQYTTKSLREALGVTIYQWNTKRQEILDYLKYYCDYEILVQGTANIYIIKEVYNQWEGMPKKKKSDEAKAYYSEKAEKVINQDKYTTGSQLARDIRKLDDFKLPHKEGTSAVYCREVLKEEYDIVDRQWRHVDMEKELYVPLTDAQLEFLKNCFKEQFSEDDNIEKKTNLINDYKNRVITQDEYKDALCSIELSAYEDAISMFIKKYGFQPRKIPGWSKKLSV